MRFRTKAMFTLVTLICVFMVAATVYFLPTTITARVTGKERVDGIFFIYTDIDSYTNQDAWYFLKWNSGTHQAKVEVGKTYDFQVYGIRSGFFSVYKNVVSFEENEKFSKELCGTLTQDTGEILKGCFLFVGKKNETD